MLSKASVKARPSVLWCYKKELGFTSHRQKRMRKIKREIARGIRTQEEAAENPFELFVSATDIRYWSVGGIDGQEQRANGCCACIVRGPLRSTVTDCHSTSQSPALSVSSVSF